MQLSQPTSKSEGVEWIKILENILVIVDSKKVEASTNGEWRAVICRCLMSLLSDKNSCEPRHQIYFHSSELMLLAAAIENFPHAVPVVLRLALLNGTPLRDLSPLLDLAVGCLEQLESIMELDLQSLSSSISDDGLILLPLAPHRSLTLHQRLQKPTSASNQRKILMSTTEMLWRASMTLDRKCAAWEKLSPRLLLWRSVSTVQEIGPAIDTSAGEWARKEAVVNLSQVTS